MVKFLKNHALLSDGSVFRNFVAVPESFVLIDEGRLPIHNWKGLLKISFTYHKVELSQNITYVLVHNSYTGYFHWLLESLPRILIAKEKLPHFSLLLPNTFTDSFYKDTLDLLGVNTVERIHAKTIYKAPKLALPYLLEPMGSFSPAIVANLKNVLLNSPLLSSVDESKLPKSGLLYVSRKKAPRRKIVNEQQVEELMLQHGFDVICFEDYTTYEQILLCSRARAIVTIHGAGLSNILFMPQGSTVIELRKFDNNLNHTYERLSHALGHKYSLLYCPAADKSQLVQDADLQVNLDDVQALLEQQMLTK